MPGITHHDGRKTAKLNVNLKFVQVKFTRLTTADQRSYHLVHYDE